MPYCTIVEFEWAVGFDPEPFANIVGGRVEAAPPEGCLSRIVGIDDKGARIIEVWRSGHDAQAYAEQSPPFPPDTPLPDPSRVFGFEVTSYVVT